MSKLLLREWRVTVGEGDALTSTGMRVAFKVKKTLEKEPNSASVSITNLSADSMRRLSKKHMPVILEAGYREDSGVIFSGDSRTVDHSHEKADWVTQIQCGDGERLFQYARMNESFGPDTPFASVARRVAAALSVGAGNLEDALKRPLAISTFKHGYTAFGPASKVFDDLMRAARWTWSIQQGVLQIKVAGEPVQSQAVRLTPETGLLGSPEYATAPTKSKPPILKCKSLLNRRLVPGHLVSISSAKVQGVFLIRTVEHSGDSHGADWFSSVECEAT